MNNLELSNINYQLSVVFRSGLPISDGISILSEDTEDKRLSEVLAGITENLDMGYSITEAFEKTSVFPKYMIEMAKVGETSGRLPEVFENLHEYYDSKAEFQKKLRNAISYPLVLLVMMFAVLGLIVFKVLPIFHSLLISLGGEVPAASMAIFNIGNVLKNSLFVIIGVFLVLLVLSLVMFKTKAMPKARSFVLLKFPVIGKIYKKNVLVKFSRAIATLISSGYSFEMAGEKSLELIEDDVLRGRFNRSLNEIRDGADVYESLEKLKIFPSLFFKMFKLGEKTGTLDEMAAKFTQTYQKELDKLMDRTANTVEPVLVTIMSIIVGVVLLVTLLPLIGIISAIG